jgi:hypothetical protein
MKAVNTFGCTCTGNVIVPVDSLLFLIPRYLKNQTSAFIFLVNDFHYFFYAFRMISSLFPEGAGDDVEADGEPTSRFTSISFITIAIKFILKTY